MFKTRLLSGIVLVVLALVLIITGGDLLLGSLLLISLIGMFELYRFFEIEKSIAAIVGYLAAVLFYGNLWTGFLSDSTALVMGTLILLMSVYVVTYFLEFFMCRRCFLVFTRPECWREEHTSYG